MFREDCWRYGSGCSCAPNMKEEDAASLLGCLPACFWLLALPHAPSRIEIRVWLHMNTDYKRGIWFVLFSHIGPWQELCAVVFVHLILWSLLVEGVWSTIKMASWVNVCFVMSTFVTACSTVTFQTAKWLRVCEYRNFQIQILNFKYRIMTYKSILASFFNILEQHNCVANSK